MNVNKHGVNRNIPVPVKKKVRKRCGFGCIVCGCAIIQYHHFNPEFVDLKKKHNADGITLLCPNCHEKVKKKIYDFDFIKMNDDDPKCIQLGYTKDILHVGSKLIGIRLGNAHFKWLDVVRYDNARVISFSQAPSGLLYLNAKFHDKNGKPLITIINNEWMGNIDQFDIETSSNDLIIREKPGEIKFHLRHVAGKEIYIERLNMYYKGFQIQVINNQFIVNLPNGGQFALACPNIRAALLLRSDGTLAIGSN